MQFWGTWCSDCSKDFPKFARWQRPLQPMRRLNLSVFPVRRMWNGIWRLKEGYRKLFDSEGVTMPVFADPAATTRGRLTGMISRGGFSYPTTLLLDRDG